jgi:hypothetical protein
VRVPELDTAFHHGCEPGLSLAAGGRLAIWCTEASEAGRTAAGLLEIDAIDAHVWGTRPVIRLRP